jgi:Flp pilus assembly pilin Flp
MLSLIAMIHAAIVSWTHRLSIRGPLTERSGSVLRHRERGQATAEYSLVLLAAAAIALVLIAWATKSGKLTRLFDAVLDQLIGKAK